ncbi:TolC family outer membrane protein [Ideonella sp. 4Y11]|uniref:TolC family outer membrane protein n=1 Tax=Ideonella aquatica TaxID=2824119 RepID=A0A941BN13_9BURK|nr:TolC family outer membrane protein [Ideonella aquatica]MBQ0961454.1 TolC family outer membrane protein [Ideonella aquatica]
MTPPRRFALHRTAALLALGLAGLSAQAQSLQELYDAARGYDATYLGAQAAASAAQYRADQANALWLPSVGLSAGASRTEADTPYSSTRSTNTNATNVALQAQQNLFNRANSVSIEQAKRGVELAQTQLRAAEQDLVVRVAQAYFDVLGAQDTLTTVQSNKKANAEQLASAKRNFEVGTATITDTREAQAKYDLILAQELAADNDLRVKRLALEQLVGKTGLAPRPLAQPVALPPLQPAEVNAWVGESESRNATIEQARLGLEVAKLETEKAQAGHLPTVALTGSYGKTHVNVSGDAVAQGGIVGYSAAGTGTNAAIGVSLSVPLFAGFAVQNRVKEALSLEEKARNDHEAARRGVAQGTRSAFFGVQAGQAQVKALEAAESSSKLALEATQLGYKVGVRVNLDVLNAQTQLFQTQRDLAKARYDVIVGGLKLRQAAGTLQPSDVANVNALLAK